jgi:hypothetical protein
MIGLDYFKEIDWHIEFYKYEHTPEQIADIIAMGWTNEAYEKNPQKISDEINFIRPKKNSELYFKVYNNKLYLALKMENRRILKIKNLRHLKQVIKILEL